MQQKSGDSQLSKVSRLLGGLHKNWVDCLRYRYYQTTFVSSLGEIRQGAPVGDFLIFVNSSSYSSFIFSCSFPCPEELLCFMYPRDSEMNRGAEGSPGKKKPVLARHQPTVTNGLGCLSRWPSHFTKEWLNGFSANWESISLWKKVTLHWFICLGHGNKIYCWIRVHYILP